MNSLFRLSALFAVALFCLTNLAATAQEDPSDNDRADAEKIQTMIEANAKQFEAWADKHSQDWESWAERFESKMDNWAQDQEKNMEKWGASYAKRWEEWAAKMKNGEFDADEMNALLEQNMEMIKEMPLGELLESGARDGLHELKNAPLGSLGELHDLIGGSLEKSLQTMEKELQEKYSATYSKAISQAKTQDLHKSLLKLQQSLMAKSKNLDKNATTRIVELENLLKKRVALDPESESRLVEDLEREVAETALRAILLKKRIALNPESESRIVEELERDVAETARRAVLEKKSAIDLFKKLKMNMREAELKLNPEGAAAQKIDEANIAMKARLKALSQAKQAIETGADQQQKSLSSFYKALKTHQSKLSSKESKIESMRREIEMLREEVLSLKKRKTEDKE